MVHQLELITDLLGSPSQEVIQKVGVSSGLSIQSQINNNLIPLNWLIIPGSVLELLVSSQFCRLIGKWSSEFHLGRHT